MRFGRKCPSIGHGLFLLFCNLSLLIGLLRPSFAQQAPASPQNPPPQSSSQPPAKQTQPQVGTFEEGTESAPPANPPEPPATPPAASHATSPATSAAPTSNPTTPAASSPSPSSTTDPALPPATRDTTRIRLGAGDLVEVSVYGVPELTTKARVSNTGELYLPLVNYIHVGDLSVEEAQELIGKQLASGGFVKEPHVSVFVNEYASQGVSVVGEVARPGTYPVLGDRKLVDMITAAGGLTERAGRVVSITHRDQPDVIQTLELGRNLTDKPDINVPVVPGDMIDVHRAPIIYVVGDVGRPSGLMVDNGTLTVLQALALAGGANRTAKLNDARILRKSDGPNGLSETPLKLKKMLEAKAPDVTLQANDILFVPLSGAKVAAARSFEAAMAITTGLAIYAVHP
jgi:polysaccharide biosynthesis/export protein